MPVPQTVLLGVGDRLPGSKAALWLPGSPCHNLTVICQLLYRTMFLNSLRNKEVSEIPESLWHNHFI